jgi:signal transduction histidine kinase
VLGDRSRSSWAERALAAERAFADTLLDAAPALALVLDDIGRILRINPAGAAACDRPAEWLAGRDWASLLDIPSRPAAREATLKALYGGSPQPFTSSLLRGAGRTRTVLWSVRRAGPYTDAPIALALGHDITDLQAAQRRALDAERLATIGQMAATLAHEGRNLLQAASACMERLAWRVQGDPEAEDLMARAAEARRGLATLFDDVQLHAAPMRLTPARCSLPELWREVWAAVIARHEGRQAELVEKVDAAEPACTIDRFRIGQVFRNILENTFDAVGGPVRVAVSCRDANRGEKPGLTITFRDNGSGLGPEQRERLFEAFYTTKARGTGLGMAIAKRVVEAHGGAIAAGDGPGAEIIIWLPRGPS